MKKGLRYTSKTLCEAASVLFCASIFLSTTTTLNDPAFASSIQVFASASEYTSDIFDEIDPNLNKSSQSPTAAVIPENSFEGPVGEEELRIAKLKTVMDRNGISPGVIDGKQNAYLKYAVGIFNQKTGSNLSLDDQSSIDLLIEEATQKSSLFVEYVISQQDVAGPFVGEIPNRIQDQSELLELGFESIEESLSERFHMDENFLKRLNPTVNFNVVGSKILVSNVGSQLQTRVASIKADMDGRRVYAYDKNQKIVAIYPASIGSPQNPSPRGNFKVRNKAGFPKYTLSASNTFEPIDDGQQVVVASGPNNPVGIAWIGLSKKSYGIHGTPWPELVGEAGSHGCIRLTNWDAMELARLVRTGIEVVIE